MTVRHRVAATALCLAAPAAWPGPERLGAQRPELQPPPSVAVIDQRPLEAAQDPGLDDAARARVRDFPQMDVHVRSSAPEQVRDPARPLRFPGASTQ